MAVSKAEVDEIRKSLSSIEGVLSSLKYHIDKIDCSNGEEHLDLIPGIDREMTLKINDIMDNFDFDCVHKVMEFLNWSWACAKTSSGVPSLDEIRDFAFDLLVRAAKERTNIASGGFRAGYDDPTEDNPEKFIQLEFILTDYEGFVD